MLTAADVLILGLGSFGLGLVAGLIAACWLIEWVRDE